MADEGEEYEDCHSESEAACNVESFHDAPERPSNEAIIDELLATHRNSIDANTDSSAPSVDTERFDALTRVDDNDAEVATSSKDEAATQREARRQQEALLSDDELEERRTRALDMKAAANRVFATGDYPQAAADYSVALDVCPLRYSRDRATLHCNRAAALLKQQLHKEAVDECTQAIELEPDSVKAFYRRAYCREQLSECLDDALADYQQVLRLAPDNVEARAATARLPIMITERNERMKREMMDQLKSLGNVFLKPFGLSTDNFVLEQNAEGGYSVRMQQ